MIGGNVIEAVSRIISKKGFFEEAKEICGVHACRKLRHGLKFPRKTCCSTTRPFSVVQLVANFYTTSWVLYLQRTSARRFPKEDDIERIGKTLLTLVEGTSHRATSSGIMNRLTSQPQARSLKVRSCQSATKEKTMTVLIMRFFDPPKGT